MITGLGIPIGDDPKDHEFNWVKARSECVMPLEFERLKDSVKKSIQEIQEPRNFDIRECSTRKFWVYNMPYSDDSEAGVLFVLRMDEPKGEDHIAVINYLRDTSFEITLTLNDNGQCRYRMDGKGEHLRWQIVRRALEPLFFQV